MNKTASDHYATEVITAANRAHSTLDEVGDLLEIAHLALRAPTFGDSGTEASALHTLVEAIEAKVVATREALNEISPHSSE